MNDNLGKQAEQKIKEWLPITLPEFEGCYEVSNYGDVRSVGRWTKTKGGGLRFRKSREMKQHKFTHSNQKYLYVVLSKDGLSRNVLVHRIIASAFIPNPDNLPAVNHIDGDPTNNQVDNLEWCTPRENTLHAMALGLMEVSDANHMRKMSRIRGKQLSKSVICVETGQTYPSIKELSDSLGYKYIYQYFDEQGVATIDGLTYKKQGGEASNV